MNNERFPHPNGHSHDDDLQPERWADAPSSDADALDALLNEIAQGNGSPNPRSGHGHQRPDVRTDTGGADALHTATRAFHRRVEAAQHRDPGSMALAPHLWEQIMTSTTQQTKEAQGSLWRDAARNTLSPGIPGQSRNHATTRRPIQRWAPVANATLALLILLAGFGIWRVYDGLNGSGPADPEGTTPGVAMQLATPEPTELPAIQAPPVATPAPITACDFSADIPIFPDGDASPIDATALLLTTGGELVLSCPEEPEPVVLASGIDQAGPGGWPGVVHTSTGGATAGDLRQSYVNIVTGESVPVGFREDAQTFGPNDLLDSPWLVAPSAADPAQWEVTDLRTMDSRMLTELMGAPWPDDTNMLISESEPGGTIAIAPFTPYQADLDEDPGGAIVQDGVLPGDVLIIDGTLNGARWITLPDDLPYREMMLSPDGAHLALRGDVGDWSHAPETVYSVVTTADGNMVGRSEPAGITDHTLGMTWAQAGNALVFLQDSSLVSIATDSDGVPETLFEVDDGLGALRTTYDPDVVTVLRVQAEEVATETPGLVQPRVYSVNTMTGEAMEFDGVAVRDSYGYAQPPSRFLVLSDGYLETTEPVGYRVIDAVTGVEYGRLADVTVAELFGRAGLGRSSFALSDDGDTEIIGFGSSQLYLARWADDTAEIRQIASPPGMAEAGNGTVNLHLSPEGSMLSLTLEGDESRTRWLLSLNGEADDWIEVPSTVPGEGPDSIFFVPGTDD